MNNILSAQALPSVNQNGEIEGRRHNPVYDEDEDDRDKLLGNLTISPLFILMTYPIHIDTISME